MAASTSSMLVPSTKKLTNAARMTRKPPPSPASETPATSGVPRIRLCSRATTREAGTVRNPIPMNKRHRDRYIRPAARIS